MLKWTHPPDWLGSQLTDTLRLFTTVDPGNHPACNAVCRSCISKLHLGESGSCGGGGGSLSPLTFQWESAVAFLPRLRWSWRSHVQVDGERRSAALIYGSLSAEINTSCQNPAGGEKRRRTRLEMDDHLSTNGKSSAISVFVRDSCVSINHVFHSRKPCHLAFEIYTVYIYLFFCLLNFKAPKDGKVPLTANGFF